MRKRHAERKVVPFQPKARDLIGQIRLLASASRNVAFSDHAYDRMDERGITTLDAVRALRIGVIEGQIRAGKRPGEWICKVVDRQPRSRALGVVTVLIRDQRLRVVTVEWEDR